MNEQTRVLLTQLAESLGTTVEYLWGALLRQAFLNGSLTLLWCIVMVITAVWWVTSWRKIKIVAESADEHLVVWANTVLVVPLVVLILISCSGNIITAFFNPEYWALERTMRLWGRCC